VTAAKRFYENENSKFWEWTTVVYFQNEKNKDWIKKKSRNPVSKYALPDLPSTLICSADWST
jgi:hypothetical protein